MTGDVEVAAAKSGAGGKPDGEGGDTHTDIHEQLIGFDSTDIGGRWQRGGGGTGSC